MGTWRYTLDITIDAIVCEARNATIVLSHPPVRQPTHAGDCKKGLSIAILAHLSAVLTNDRMMRLLSEKQRIALRYLPFKRVPSFPDEKEVSRCVLLRGLPAVGFSDQRNSRSV